MDEHRQGIHDECTGVDTGSTMSVSVALGVAAGCILGLMLGNVVLYLALGVSVGVLGSYMNIVAGLTDAEQREHAGDSEDEEASEKDETGSTRQ